MVRKILYLCIGLFILARDQKTEKKKKKKSSMYRESVH